MKKIMVLLILSSFLLVPDRGLALSCAEPSPPDVAFDEYDAVLIGSVAGIENTSENKKLTIDVQKSFKGVDEKTITVSEDITWGESQENATYLFFLDKDGDKWIHPLCSPTTHNTAVADEEFSDKEEITLQEVAASRSDSYNFAPMALIAVLTAITIAGVWIKLTKQSRAKH